MEYSEFDRHPAYARADDRRTGPDRRGAVRRERDRTQRMREMVAFAVAMCGGFALLWLFFVIIGTVDVGEALGATVAAVVLAVVWLIAFAHRIADDASMTQRPDRERRGF